jgi:hypothetical protein
MTFGHTVYALADENNNKAPETMFRNRRERVLDTASHLTWQLLANSDPGQAVV